MLGYFRLLLAIGVLAAHVSNFLSEATSRAMVGCFFIVSGYLIALTIEKKYQGRPFAFYRNRILRIYPIYLIIALVTLLTYAPWFDRRVESLGGAVYSFELFKTLLLTFDNAYFLVAPAWSLPYELLFYLLAPLVFGLSFKRLPIGLLLFFVLSMIFFVTENSADRLLVPFSYVHVGRAAIFSSFVLFSIGSLAYYLSKRVNVNSGQNFFQLLGLLGIVIVLIFGSRFISPDGGFYDKNYAHWIGLISYCSAIILLITWNRTDSKYTKLAGDLTYPVYLVHWPILNSKFFESDFVRNLNQAASRLIPFGDLLFVIFLLLAVTIFVSYFLVRFEKTYISPLRAD